MLRCSAGRRSLVRISRLARRGELFVPPTSTSTSLSLTPLSSRSSARTPSISRPTSTARSISTTTANAIEATATATATAKGTSPRLILGIESSCDDSCASVVCSDRRILSSVVIKQDHSLTGGIHPLHAAMGHHSNIPLAISRALSDAGVTIGDVAAIAVTRGPGMTSSLSVGLTAAKTLAAVHGVPLVYVHHMQAHALTPLLACQSDTMPESESRIRSQHHDQHQELDSSTPTQPAKAGPAFPFLTLLVSGGHTMLVLAQSVGEFKILANTSDDSIGEAFDKVARDLGIPWTSAPGAALEALAAEATCPTSTSISTAAAKQEHVLAVDVDTAVGKTSKNEKEEKEKSRIKFPVPCKGQPKFSFSGLKSAVSRFIEAEIGNQQTQTRGMGMGRKRAAEIAHAFQVAACEQLSDKLRMVLRPSPSSPLSCSFGDPGGLVGKDPKGRLYPRISLLPGSLQANFQQTTEQEAEGGGEKKEPLLQAESIQSVVVSGGVASNAFLRSTLRKCLDEMGRGDVGLYFPPLELCTDNAAMVAWTAHLDWSARTRDTSKLARAKWSLEELRSEPGSAVHFSPSSSPSPSLSRPAETQTQSQTRAQSQSQVSK
ncbi:peptidase M22, glycoprotease [Testicularia cyperi]|uniref:N(6)-L-threonylcarbamoyladenine synthase n=1 Tax=Testicularia cyperi TaxID=1882483 RepID=A0A317XTH3_9BASI|nr:peptidase M22, glycoprotease [Testicularia cyperi]